LLGGFLGLLGVGLEVLLFGRDFGQSLGLGLLCVLADFLLALAEVVELPLHFGPGLCELLLLFPGLLEGGLGLLEGVFGALLGFGSLLGLVLLEVLCCLLHGLLGLVQCFLCLLVGGVLGGFLGLLLEVLLGACELLDVFVGLLAVLGFFAEGLLFLEHFAHLVLGLLL